MTDKLTLSVSADVTERAKAYAHERKTTLTSLVEGYLDALTSDARNPVSCDERDVDGFEGNILSALGGCLHQGDKNSTSDTAVAAFLEGGWLVLVEGHDASGETVRLLQRVHENKMKVTRRSVVSRGTFLRLHQRCEARLSHEMVQVFETIVSDAAASRSTDIHIKVGEFTAEIFRKAEKGSMQPMSTVSVDVAMGMIRVLIGHMEEWECHGIIGRSFVKGGAVSLPAGVHRLRVQTSIAKSGGTGSTMIIRLVMSLPVAHSLGELGFSRAQVVSMEKFLRSKLGLLVVAGPAGCGKSTTASTLMRVEAASYPLRRQASIGDAMSCVPPTTMQVNLEWTNDGERNRIRVAQAFHAVCYNGMDTLMLNPVPDRATLDVALEASGMGMRVLATVHANDTMAITSRFRYMNPTGSWHLTDPGTISLLVAQRLVRKVCPHCSVPFLEAVLKGLLDVGLANRVFVALPNMHDRVRVVNPEGCEQCGHGCAERTLVAECVAPDRTMLTLLAHGCPHEAQAHAKDNLGMTTMLENAVARMSLGFLDPRDVEDIFGELDNFDPSRLALVLEHNQ